MNLRYFPMIASVLLACQIYGCKKIESKSSQSLIENAVSTRPWAPTAVSGEAGDKQVTLTWKAPANNGGSAVIDYVIQYSADSVENWTLATDTVSAETNAVVKGLTNGSVYFFRVAAVNSVGIGDFSAVSAQVALPVPRTLYFNNAVDGDWQTLGNWWLDDQFTQAATNLPTSIDDVRIVGPKDGGFEVGVLTNRGEVPTVANVYVASSTAQNIYVSIILNVTGLATFDGGDNGNSYLYTRTPEKQFAVINGNARFINNASIYMNRDIANAAVNGTATFDDNAYNWGTVNGTAIFNGESNNQNGVINGNAIFNGTSTNSAVVNGGATFNGNSVNTSTVTGSATFNDGSINSGTILDHKPGAPTNLSGVLDKANRQVALSWTLPSLNGSAITGYLVEYKQQDNTNWSTFGDGPSVGTSRTVTNLVIGKSYVLRVAAVNTFGTGLYSEEVSITLPDWSDVTTTDGATISSCALTPSNCTMRDNGTGIWWSKYQGSMSWDLASSTCDNLVHNGRSNWRLPSTQELLTASENKILAAIAPNWLTWEDINNTQSASGFWAQETFTSINRFTGQPYDSGAFVDIVNVGFGSRMTSYYTRFVCVSSDGSTGN